METSLTQAILTTLSDEELLVATIQILLETNSTALFQLSKFQGDKDKDKPYRLTTEQVGAHAVVTELTHLLTEEIKRRGILQRHAAKEEPKDVPKGPTLH
jgi:hypothetical protein